MDILIPLPPLAIQKTVAKACAAVDADYAKAKKTIDDGRAKIAAIMAGVKGDMWQIRDVAEYVTERVDYSQIAPENYISTENMLQQCGGIVPYDGKPNVGGIIAFRKGDILVSNIRPYLKKLWLADCDGGCSPDVLVFRAVGARAPCDHGEVDATSASLPCMPEYIALAMKQDSFFDFMMSGVKGMKMPRGDKKKTLTYSIPVPSLAEQKKVVAAVEAVEAKIAAAKETMSACPARKREILRRHGVVM